MKHLKTYKKFYESIGSPLLDLSDNVDQHLISQIQKSVKPTDSILEISEQLYNSNQTERKNLFILWRLNTLQELGLSNWTN